MKRSPFPHFRIEARRPGESFSYKTKTHSLATATRKFKTAVARGYDSRVVHVWAEDYEGVKGGKTVERTLFEERGRVLPPWAGADGSNYFKSRIKDRVHP